MIRRHRTGILAMFGFILLQSAADQAQQTWVVDIFANPPRYWNVTVTVVGQVQDATANPSGTTRGTYTLLDDSTPATITVRTTDLPPVGRTFTVVGVVLNDPSSERPVLKEVSRSPASPGAAPVVPSATAPRASVSDIFADPERYRNRTVTVVGRVRDTVASPAGSTRGAYTLFDDSGPMPIMVGTDALPPVGKTLSVVGIVVQDPTLPAVVLKEVSRAATGAEIPPPTGVPPSTSDGRVWIADILANPARYWNLTVTIVGEVQGTEANPAGTTRGTYTLLDDSSPMPMMVRTADLPPVGRAFSVVGVVIQDPASDIPVLRETRRSSARR